MKSTVYILVTMVLWGVIPVLDKYGLSGERVSPLIGLIVRLCGAFLVLLLLFPFSNALPELKSTSWRALLVFAASGIISMILAQYFYYEALKEKEVSRLFPVLFGGAPVVGVILGILVLGEKISVASMAGCGLIVLGSILMFY